ncbi:unnamed protein product, partial [Mycena citricolor]
LKPTATTRRTPARFLPVEMLYSLQIPLPHHPTYQIPLRCSSRGSRKIFPCLQLRDLQNHLRRHHHPLRHHRAHHRSPQPSHALRHAIF